MAIEDSNPERRNLVVLSMAIIAFYVGEATVGNELSLPLVKLTFNDAQALGYLAWVMLAWFWFKYWITAKNEIRDKINHELNNKRYGLFLFSRKLRQVFLLNPNHTVKFIKFRRFESVDGEPSTLHLYDTPDPEDFDPDMERREAIAPNVREDLFLRFILFVALVRLFFSHPTLSSYYAPYILVIFAVVLGVSKSCCKCIGV